VYRAHDRQDGQHVAIKMIDKAKIKKTNVYARVCQEVEIHNRLKHPSIVELYSFFEDETYVYLVQEMCDGGELYSHLQRVGKLSLLEIRSIFSQIINGLIYLHRHRILHRDLSWSNILLSSDKKTIKISDFGIATQIETPDQLHQTMCGTPNFISPEVASHSPYGLASDIWSLGCILYTLFAGNPPFHSKSMHDTMQRAIKEPISFPDCITPDVQGILTQMLDKNPQNRPTIEEIAQHPFLIKKNLHSSSDSGIFFSTDSRRSRNTFTAHPLSLPTIKTFTEADSPEHTTMRRSVTNLNKNFSPLKSARLEAYKYRKQNYQLEIDNHSWVHIKNPSTSRREEMQISPDGYTVYLSGQDGKNFKNYTFDLMPQSAWKRYKFAAKFVKLFRSKTPKITLFDNEFKHVLMESGDFYCSQGPRLILIGSTDNRMHIYEREEKICTIPAGNDSEPLISVPSKFRLIASMARAGQKRILDIEEILSKTNCPVFPAILGRNCAKNFENKTLTIINESLNLNLNSLTHENSAGSKSDSVQLKFVPNVGWVSARQGCMFVHFVDDNSLLEISGDSLVYRDCEGRTVDNSEPHVQRRIQILPSILRRYKNME